MTAASFKLKYAATAFLVVLLAAAAVVTLFLVRHDSDTRTLGTLAEQAARERVTPELAARAQELAVHAADSIAGAVRAGDSSGMVRRLQPFMDNTTVAAITVTGSAGKPLFSWQRGAARPAGALTSEATAAVRTYVENIPGAATPATLANLTLVLEQAAPVAAVSVGGRLEAANAARLRFTWLMSLALAALGAIIAGVLAWRAVSALQRPLASLIKSADRIGQGDYTRPVEVRRRDELGELRAGAGAHARALAPDRRSTRTTCTASSTA